MTRMDCACIRTCVRYTPASVPRPAPAGRGSESGSAGTRITRPQGLLAAHLEFLPWSQTKNGEASVLPSGRSPEWTHAHIWFSKRAMAHTTCSRKSKRKKLPDSVAGRRTQTPANCGANSGPSCQAETALTPRSCCDPDEVAFISAIHDDRIKGQRARPRPAFEPASVVFLAPLERALDAYSHRQPSQCKGVCVCSRRAQCNPLRAFAPVG
jgi:hypothetical protein